MNTFRERKTSTNEVVSGRHCQKWHLIDLPTFLWLLGERMDDDDPNAKFWPLQYPKEMSRTQYKQGDRDWQEFIKLSKDVEQQKTLRSKSVNSVLPALKLTHRFREYRTNYCDRYSIRSKNADGTWEGHPLVEALVGFHISRWPSSRLLPPRVRENSAVSLP